MGELSARNFGLLIAYMLPGFAFLAGASSLVPALRGWLVGFGPGGPSVGGLFYVTIGSVGSGMVLSACRWLVIDSIHHSTGIARPNWDDAALPGRLQAFELLVENHYRYFQFYANTFVALLVAYPLWRFGSAGGGGTWATDMAFLLVQGVLFAGSRDALRNYYRRSALLLGPVERTKDHDERQSSDGARGRSDPEQIQAGD